MVQYKSELEQFSQAGSDRSFSRQSKRMVLLNKPNQRGREVGSEQSLSRRIKSVGKAQSYSYISGQKRREAWNTLHSMLNYKDKAHNYRYTRVQELRG